MNMEQLTIDLGERSYPIYIGEGLLHQAAELFERHRISKASPLMIITDENVAKHHLRLLRERLQAAGFRTVEAIVPAGEQSKSLSRLEQLITAALEGGLDRQSAVVALGGGVVGDLAGFTAASYMRGIRFVQVPTTILAHDSSVGGKVGVNHPLAKNMIGAFHQPELVLYDTALLRTLPDREVRAGLSEVIKHGLIHDRSFVDWCAENAEKLLALDAEALQYALYQGCKIKSLVVAQDERENGLRAILNLGHTIGHALEAVAHYNELLHGEAISIGMAGAAKLSVRMGNPPHIYSETRQLLSRFGLPVRVPDHLAVDDIMQAMSHDKKFKAGSMVFIIPTEIGQVQIDRGVSPQLVRDIVTELKGEA